MTQLIQSELKLTAIDEGLTTNRKTPRDIGNGLFKDLLNKTKQSTGNGGWGLSLFGDKASKLKGMKGQSDGKKDPLEEFEKRFAQLGIPMGQMRLPGSAIPRLIAFLEKQGLNREKIERMILSATGQEGMVHMDKLMALLQKIRIEDNGAGNSSLIEARHVPQLQEMLFNMGLSAENIKEVIEKSVTQKGQVDLSKLSGVLDKFFPDSVTEKGLTSLLKRHNIKGNPEGLAGQLKDPEVGTAFKNFTEAVSQDMQKKIKETIAALLREKGVPPQEVKGFLETLTVESVKSQLKKTNPELLGLTKAQLEADANYLFGRVVIRSQKEWKNNGWQEKFLKVFNGESLSNENGLKEIPFREGSMQRINFASFMEEIEKKTKPMLENPAATLEKRYPGVRNGKRNKNVTGPITKGQKAIGTTPNGKESIAPEFQTTRMAGNKAEMVSPTETKHVINLPQPLPKIVDRMVWMIRAGEQRSRLQIHPPELGRVDLDVVIKQGHLQVNMGAETLNVKELIEANLNQLKQQLSDLGFNVDKFDVMVGLGDRRFNEGDARMAKGRQDHRDRRSKGKTENIETDNRLPRRSGLGLHEVDIRV